jgi:hypothetical protein
VRIRIVLVGLALLGVAGCGEDAPTIPDPGAAASRAASNLATRLPTALPSVPSVPTSLPSLPTNLPTKLPTSIPSFSLPGAEGMQRFVSTVKSQVPEAAKGRSDAEIAGVGLQACTLLKSGRPASEITARTRSLGTLDAEAVDEATARELVKLAIDTMCIDQKSRVDEF